MGGGEGGDTEKLTSEASAAATLHEFCSIPKADLYHMLDSNQGMRPFPMLPPAPLLPSVLPPPLLLSPLLPSLLLPSLLLPSLLLQPFFPRREEPRRQGRTSRASTWLGHQR